MTYRVKAVEVGTNGKVVTEARMALEEPDPVPEGVGPARMIEAAFSVSAYVRAMSYDTKKLEKETQRKVEWLTCAENETGNIEESITLTFAVNDISTGVLSTGQSIK